MTAPKTYAIVKRERGFYEPREVWSYFRRGYKSRSTAWRHMKDYRKGYVENGGDPSDFKVVEEKQA